VPEISGQLATALVQRYRDRFGRGPTESKAFIADDHALVILGSPQTDVERSLVLAGQVDEVELLRRRVRQLAADEFCSVVEQIVGRKVAVMLGDHSAAGNITALVFIFEREQP
jgi:uncharacterized protein YbcI